MSEIVAEVGRPATIPQSHGIYPPHEPVSAVATMTAPKLPDWRLQRSFESHPGDLVVPPQSLISSKPISTIKDRKIEGERNRKDDGEAEAATDGAVARKNLAELEKKR
ncbi:hypothetical protein TIFTF001_007969 [Ficus carica]|uniref:Uncharacterized protein n=1 Tax=Ficus carica TaxID=3494 RepID=A0AA88AE92_FICCA|nr:hypothetical protein TIFTF001_007969 [Ficus carica]